MIHGLPLSVTSDNGPQFVLNEFEKYLEDCGIEHRKTTPLWSQANGEVERQNRSLLKRMQIAQAEGKQWKEEVHKYLIAYRSTPHTTAGVSPAELLFGRKIRTKLPEFRKDNVASEVRDRDSEMKAKAKLYADEKRHAEYSDLVPGDEVLLKQERQNKLSTPFAPELYDVVSRNGSSIVIKSPESVLYERNKARLKKYEAEAVDPPAVENAVDAGPDHTDLETDCGKEKIAAPTRPVRHKKLAEKF